MTVYSVGHFTRFMGHTNLDPNIWSMTLSGDEAPKLLNIATSTELSGDLKARCYHLSG